MLEFPWQAIEEGRRVREVAPGVLWIRMPMPHALDHINLWAIRDGGTAERPAGWTIVDTGMHTDDTVAIWQAMLAAEGELKGAPVSRIVVTHMHPDHVGMAGWLTRRCGARLWMTQLEYMSCRVMAGDSGREAPQDGVDFYRRAGWTVEDLATYRKRFGSFGRMIHPLPDSYRRLRHGDILRIGDHDWRVVEGGGHSPEHACLYCPGLKLFISGDQVIAGISSNVSVFPNEPEANPLKDWLEAIPRIRTTVPDDVLVLPSHKLPFRGLHERLDALRDSALRALQRAREALVEPRRVVDLFPVLFARAISNPLLLGLATGETLANLNYLIANGEVTSTLEGDGATRYVAAGRVGDAAAQEGRTAYK